MKRRKRQRKIAKPQEAESDSVESDEDSDVIDPAVAAADMEDFDFELFEPEEDDYHTVSTWLRSGTWDFVDVNFAEMTDSVVGQGNIGSLVKSTNSESDEDPTVCGLLTTLNLRQFSQLSWPGTIRKSLLAKAKKHAASDVHSKLDSLLGGKQKGTEVGLLLSERLFNLPLELLPPLHKTLQDAIEWSCKTPECPADERPFYFFTHFVGVAKCAPGGADATSSAAAPSSKKKRRRDGAAASSSASARASAFYRPEDELYVSKAAYSFTFPVTLASKKDSCGGSEGPSERRTVFVISRKAFEECVAELPNHLAAMA